MNMTQITSSRSLPEDLIMEILSRLPGKSLLRFKSASKSMLNLITSPDFVKLYLCRSHIRNSTTVVLLRSGNNFALADLDQPQRPAVKLDIHPDVIKLLQPIRYLWGGKEYYVFKIIGICNGVVCFRKVASSRKEEEFFLYDLATRVYKQVPILKVSRNRHPFDDEFVYDSISDDFKIFRFMRHSDAKTQMDSESYMYNLTDNSWSKIGNPPPGLRPHRYCNHIASNYLYWVAFKIDLKASVVVRFDISTNTYEEISLPAARVVPSSCYPKLGVLNGRLHITSNGLNPEIWMLKEDNCWTQVFRCSSKWEYPVKRCLFYSIDGRKIFLALRNKVRKFICCDLDSQTTSVVEILGLPDGTTFKVMPYRQPSMESPLFQLRS